MKGSSPNPFPKTFEILFPSPVLANYSAVSLWDGGTVSSNLFWPDMTIHNHGRLVFSVFINFFFIEQASATSYQVKQQDGLSVYYRSRHQSQAEVSLKILIEARDEIATRLSLPKDTSSSIVLVPSEKIFNEMVGTKHAHLRLLGVAFSPKGRILLNLAQLSPIGTNPLYETLTHELVHTMLGAYEHKNGVRLPKWLNEGIACWLSSLFISGPNDKRLQTAVNLGNILPFYKLNKEFPDYRIGTQLAYLQSEAFVRFIAGRHGPTAIAKILETYGTNGHLRNAVMAAIGVDLLEEETAWLKSLKSRHPILWLFQNHFTILSLGALLTILSFVLYRFKRAHAYQKWLDEETLIPILDSIAFGNSSL